MVFFDSPDRASNFIISFTKDPRKDFGVFAEGYARAASVLAEHLLSQPRFPDYEAYPVVFLYRQSFELYLKGFLYQSAMLAGFKEIDGIDSRLPYTHKLGCLTKIMERVFKILFSADPHLKEILDKVTTLSSDLESIDPESYSYRYPIN